MSQSYDAYLRRFSASRGGTLGLYTVANGLLVRRLSRQEFDARWSDLREKLLLHQHLRRRDHTMPLGLEKSVRELMAELLLPGDLWRGDATAPISARLAG